MSVVYEDQNTDISWYNNAMPAGGSAKNNFERIIALRKLLCHPLTIMPSGELNKDYFSTASKETAMNWKGIELLQLYEGIYKHGIGDVECWIKINNDFLPQRDFIEVRLKLMQLFGTQTLSQYNGRSFKSEKEIKDEYEKNKEIALKNGTWSEKVEMSVKKNVANLSDRDRKKQQREEIEHWNKHIYNNTSIVYRVNNKNKGGSRNNNNKNKNKNKSKSKKAKKKTIQKMFMDQAAKANKKQQEKEEREKQQKQTEEKENNVNKNKNKNDQHEPKKVNKNTNKSKPKKGKTKKQQLLDDDDSEDEEMLCVE